MATSRSSVSPRSSSGGSISEGPAYHPATCVSEYGVVLGEEAIPFVVATDLTDEAAQMNHGAGRGRLSTETAAVVGIALHRALVGSRRRDSVGGVWYQTALREMTEQRR